MTRDEFNKAVQEGCTKFVVQKGYWSNGFYDEGDVLELTEDDNSNAPFFLNIDKCRPNTAISLKKIEPMAQISRVPFFRVEVEPKTVVDIPTIPGKNWSDEDLKAENYFQFQEDRVAELKAIIKEAKAELASIKKQKQINHLEDIINQMSDRINEGRVRGINMDFGDQVVRYMKELLKIKNNKGEN